MPKLHHRSPRTFGHLHDPSACGWSSWWSLTRRGRSHDPRVCLPIHYCHFQGCLGPRVVSGKPAYWRKLSKNTLAPESSCSLHHSTYCKKVQELWKGQAFLAWLPPRTNSSLIDSELSASLTESKLFFDMALVKTLRLPSHFRWHIWRDVVWDAVNQGIYSVPVNEIRFRQWHCIRTQPRYGTKNDHV